MTSNRPYLLRALYEWLVDNDCTPHILVSIDYPGVQVPEGHAVDGQIVLNVSPNATRQLRITNEAVQFDGRFSGQVHSLYVPTPAIMAIYARENGQGMVFDMEPPPAKEAFTEEAPAPSPARPTGRPSLKVIK